MASKATDKNRTTYLLDEKDIPTKWYNIQADFKTPAPPVLHPGTKQPIGPADLAPLFPMELIKQEVSQQRWIEIPDEIRDVYRLLGPSPLYPARRVASPSPDTQSGKKVLEQDPNSPGSLGIAISEAVEDAATRDDTKYSLGSVLNHVLMHQTVIGLEARKQLEKADDAADIVIGCAGGGSNFAGLSFPFAADKLTGKNKKMRIVAVEPAACPSLTKGKYVYDFGDTVGLTPLVKMHTLGHTFIPAPLHAGGLRYHGMAPLVSKLYDEGVIEAVAVPHVATVQAALQVARTES